METDACATKGCMDESGNYLYVVLHGLICLVDAGPFGFIAHVLDVGDDHVYLGGDWLLERPLPGRSRLRPAHLQLVGVHPGGARLDDGLNACVSLSSVPDPAQPGIRTVINLPRPKCIRHFVQARLPQTPFSGNRGKFCKQPSVVSGISLFIYKFDCYRYVEMVYDDGAPFWKCPEPAPVQYGNNKFYIATTHVYAEPEQSMPDEHVLGEFNLSLAFLGASDIKLQSSFVTSLTNNLYLPGLLPGEVVPYDERNTFAEQLLFQARTGKFAAGASAGSGSAAPVCGGAHGVVTPTGG